MRSDDVLLVDMLIACEKILRFTKDVSKIDFMDNELIQSAVIRELQVIGEVGRMMSEEGKTQYTDIEWKEISGMRNRLIHEYFIIRLDIVWQVVIADIPKLIAAVTTILPSSEDNIL